MFVDIFEVLANWNARISQNVDKRSEEILSYSTIKTVYNMILSFHPRLTSNTYSMSGRFVSGDTNTS